MVLFVRLSSHFWGAPFRQSASTSQRLNEIRMKAPQPSSSQLAMARAWHEVVTVEGLRVGRAGRVGWSLVEVVTVEG